MMTVMQSHSFPYEMTKHPKRELNTADDYNVIAKKCFEHAEGFRIICFRCCDMLVSHDLPALATNLAFACELYMKSILFNRRIDCRDTHDLYGLYELLETEDKKQIRQLRTRKMGKEGFELTLKENGKAFVIFRYLYERTSMVSDIQFLSELMDRCREIGKEDIKP